MGQKVFFQSILLFSLCAATSNVIYFGLLSLKPGFFTFRKRLSLCNFPREWTKTNSLKLNHTRGFWSLQWPILERNHPSSARLAVAFDLKPSQHPQQPYWQSSHFQPLTCLVVHYNHRTDFFIATDSKCMNELIHQKPHLWVPWWSKSNSMARNMIRLDLELTEVSPDSIFFTVSSNAG